MCMVVKDRYIDPFTDFGFKWLFGTEENKDLLISFLNDLLDIEDKIVDVTYRNLEKLGLSVVDRKAVFDIYCTDEKGSNFIVELQRAKQKFFKDRSLYYTSFPIQEQAKRGDWDYELKPVYFVGILEFNFDDRENYLTKVELMDADTKERFYDKLTYYYLEMPKFKKQKEELANHLEHWLYVLNNLANLQDIPEEFRDDDCIHKAFDVAEFLRLDKDRQFAYQQDLKTRLDYKNTLDYATEVAKEDGFLDGLEQGIEQGIEKGIEQGKYQEKLDIAKNLLGAGVSVEQIAIATGLSEEEVIQLTK
jgi:predicted transposase/invertase (TIGR01784 family)